jgi:hypothetical protein
MKNYIQGHTPIDQDRPLLPLLKNIDYEPIFILGDHRSGTTILYQLLTSAGCFNYVSFYNIARYEQVLHNHVIGATEDVKEELERLLISLGVEDRIFDRVKVSPDLPEEYGYILWRNAPFWYLPRLNRRNLPNLIELNKKIQFTQNPERPVLLKGPWDFPNFMFAKRAFPTARFIFIHRHPLRVINSKLKGMRSALAKKNPYTALLAPGYARLFRRPLQLFFARILFSSNFNLGLRLVTQYSLQAIGYFLTHVGSLSREEYISVKYEDLCQDPERTINRILNHFRLHAIMNPAYDELIKPRSPNFLPEIQQKYEQILKRLEPVIYRYGYNV